MTMGQGPTLGDVWERTVGRGETSTFIGSQDEKYTDSQSYNIGWYFSWKCRTFCPTGNWSPKMGRFGELKTKIGPWRTRRWRSNLHTQFRGDSQTWIFILSQRWYHLDPLKYYRGPYQGCLWPSDMSSPTYGRCHMGHPLWVGSHTVSILVMTKGINTGLDRDPVLLLRGNKGSTENENHTLGLRITQTLLRNPRLGRGRYYLRRGWYGVWWRWVV